ncbi:MAG: TolC family protein [Quinella sp. 1Q5]|nr:TolC family protein [Quinella sp. 1Q5]
MKIKFLLALLSAMFATTQLASAEFQKLNLDDCIDLALKNNRTIEQSVELRENAKWILKRQRRATGSSLSWSGAVNKIGGKDYVTRRATSDSNYEHTFDNTLRLSYLLYSGGRNENNIASAQLNLNSADLNLENTKQQVVFDTTSAYYDVLRNKNLVNVKESTVDLLQKHLDQVTSKFQIGVVPGSDILSSKVQLANAVQSLVTSQKDYDNALATLSNLIGLPISEDLLVEDNMSYQKFVVNLQFPLFMPLKKPKKILPLLKLTDCRK